MSSRRAKMILERQGSEVGPAEREALHAAWARRLRLSSQDQTRPGPP